MGTRNAGVVSSNPTRVTNETPLVRKAMGNHVIKSTSVEKAQSPVSGFYCSRNRVCDAGSCSRIRNNHESTVYRMVTFYCRHSSPV